MHDENGDSTFRTARHRLVQDSRYASSEADERVLDFLSPRWGRRCNRNAQNYRQPDCQTLHVCSRHRGPTYDTRTSSYRDNSCVAWYKFSPQSAGGHTARNILVVFKLGAFQENRIFQMSSIRLW